MTRQRTNPADTPASQPPASLRAGLAQALTFHASFDHGADADFAIGDKQVYTVTTPAGPAADPAPETLTPGLGSPPLSVRPNAGKYGGALAFTQERSHVVVYKVEQNVAYSPTAFCGTVSFWMNLDPAEIPGQYCDPLQVTDKRFSDDCIWVDFTKNDAPSDFRLGVFGNRAGWDVKNREADSQEFYWRLLKVEEPPFAKGKWTHVVVTWDGLNNSQQGRARLYFDGAYQGATGVIREPFTWDVSQARIRLGTGRYVGLLDDLAFFNRPLTAAEIAMLGGLERGVGELYG
ncbi:MAG: hypothetical protein KJZ93_07970 [Caldilineaceae bacterium]|nr:hypothetical protein [Caldilineaceae bacterium]